MKPTFINQKLNREMYILQPYYSAFCRKTIIKKFLRLLLLKSIVSKHMMSLFIQRNILP
ncbi:MAG: hypothetical protein OFPII_34570 [Osedax symbiont Rs1]|nr:MAG: hypothetical protein OFPII_34570 [Osedax symbiont Rs1]